MPSKAPRIVAPLLVVVMLLATPSALGELGITASVPATSDVDDAWDALPIETRQGLVLLVSNLRARDPGSWAPLPSSEVLLQIALRASSDAARLEGSLVEQFRATSVATMGNLGIPLAQRGIDLANESDETWESLLALAQGSLPASSGTTSSSQRRAPSSHRERHIGKFRCRRR